MLLHHLEVGFPVRLLESVPLAELLLPEGLQGLRLPVAALTPLALYENIWLRFFSFS